MQKNCRKCRKVIFFVLGTAEDTPSLLDGVIDSSHRSFLAVVQRVKLNVLGPRQVEMDYVSKNTFVSYTFRT